MAAKKTSPRRYAAIIAIWALAVGWSIYSIAQLELGGVLAGLAFGAIAPLCLRQAIPALT